MPFGSLSIGCEEHLDLSGTGSFYNEGETEIVLQHVLSLVGAGKYANVTHIFLLLNVQ